LGVLYALMEDDIKRLLAYSSVENMGIITLGMGAAFLFQSLAMPRAAALALAAALYHALNHAAFKCLLFQALLPGIGVAAPLIAVLMVLALAMLALTAGLAAAAFVKCFGITFLAIPRSDAAAAAHESPVSMRA